MSNLSVLKFKEDIFDWWENLDEEVAFKIMFDNIPIENIKDEPIEDIFNELSLTEQERIIGEAYAKEHKIIIE